MSDDDGNPDELVDEEDRLGWWTISGTALLGLLRRAHDGEDPDMLYAEEYVNADREYPGERR